MRQKYEVIRIDEMDYGCEGIPEGEELMVMVWLKAEDGTKQTIRYQDALLYASQIDIGTWVTYEDGQLTKQ